MLINNHTSPTFTKRQQQLANKNIKIDCIVPVHNEAQNISAFLENLPKAVVTDEYIV